MPAMRVGVRSRLYPVLFHCLSYRAARVYVYKCLLCMCEENAAALDLPYQPIRRKRQKKQQSFDWSPELSQKREIQRQEFSHAAWARIRQYYTAVSRVSVKSGQPCQHWVAHQSAPDMAPTKCEAKSRGAAERGYSVCLPLCHKLSHHNKLWATLNTYTSHRSDSSQTNTFLINDTQ